MFKRHLRSRSLPKKLDAKVDHWLMEFVSTQMGADTPTLVIGGHPVWRVPAHIELSARGQV